MAFTPTIGVQAVTALFLATLCNANRPAALVATALTNPLTTLPAMALTYWVGTLFWAGPPWERVAGVLRSLLVEWGTRSFWDPSGPLAQFAALSRDVFVPLWIGGVLVGALAGAVVYLVLVRVLRAAARRRRARADPASPGPAA